MASSRFPRRPTADTRLRQPRRARRSRRAGGVGPARRNAAVSSRATPNRGATDECMQLIHHDLLIQQRQRAAFLDGPHHEARAYVLDARNAAQAIEHDFRIGTAVLGGDV